jgi:hypothetical protein
MRATRKCFANGVDLKIWRICRGASAESPHASSREIPDKYWKGDLQQPDRVGPIQPITDGWRRAEEKK